MVTYTKKALEATTEEELARYLPWSEETQEKCKISSICTEKYQHNSKKEAECYSI